MPQRPRDEAREQRIHDEIVVDAYGPEEQATGWYGYLEGTLQFPFLTRCVAERAISPLRIGDEVEVVGMAPAEECAHEMFVETPWERRTLAVPLAQLAALPVEAVDEETRQAVEDWRYWVERGYTF
jgi:hypothetical protein